MENDSTSGTLTSNIDQKPQTGLIFYADQPARAQEIAAIKRMKRLRNIWLVLGVSAQLAGTLILSRYVDQPYSIFFIVLWGVTLWSIILMGHRHTQLTVIETDHFWEDRLDHSWHEFNRLIIEPLNALADETHGTVTDTREFINQIVLSANEIHEEDRRIAKQRGKGKDTGRPESTREEWIQRGLKIIEVEDYRNRQQVTYEQACARAGVVYSTFRDWRRRIPKDCMNEARTLAQARLTRN